MTDFPRLVDVLQRGRERVIGAWDLGGTIVDPGPESRIETLLSKMTLREKLGQLNMVASGYAVTGPLLGGDSPDAIRSGDIGNLLNMVGVDHVN